MPAIALLLAGAVVPARAQSLPPGATQPARSLPARVANPSRPPTLERRTVLRNVTILRGKTSVEVHIEASGPVKPVAIVLSGPERIVVDLANVSYDRARRLSVNSGDVQDVRVALFQADPPVTRVVVDLARAHDYRLLPAGSTVILAIDTSSKPAEARQSVPAKIAPAAVIVAPPPATAPVVSKIPPTAEPTLPKLRPAEPAQPEAPARAPAESPTVPVTQPSEPSVSAALPEVTTLPAPTNPARLSTAGEEETTPHQAAKANKPGLVRSVTVSREKDAIEIHIEGSKPLRTSASTLSNPERIIIDLADVRVQRPRRIPVNAAGVRAVNVSVFLVNPLVTRVTVDLAHARPYHLHASGNSLTVRIETDEVKAAGSQPVR